MERRSKRALGALLLLAPLGGLVWLLSRYEVVLRVRAPVDVSLVGDLPARATLSQDVQVELHEELEARARLAKLDVPIDDILDVPLNLSLDVPIHAVVEVRDALHIETDVPIETVLTERELDLSTLVVPIDTEIFVDDVIEVSTVVPLDTQVQTALGIRVPVKADLPVRARVPVRQKLRVRDRIPIAIERFRLPLKARVHVSAEVPLRAPLQVSGRATVPVKQRVRIPIKQTLHPVLAAEVPVSVRIDGAVPARLSTTLDTTVHVEQAVSTQLGPVRFGLTDLTLARDESGR